MSTNSAFNYSSVLFISEGLEKPQLVIEEDRLSISRDWPASKVIGSLNSSQHSIQVIWRPKSVLSGEDVLGISPDPSSIQKNERIDIGEISLFLNGKRIGFILVEPDFMRSDSSFDGYFVQQVTLAREFRGRGLGSAMYIYMASTLYRNYGKRLRQGSSQSQEAKKVWANFSRLGFFVYEYNGNPYMSQFARLLSRETELLKVLDVTK